MSASDLRWHVEAASEHDRIARFRRTVLDAQASFEALATQDSLTSLSNAVLSLDETSAKRALIAAASNTVMKRPPRNTSAGCVPVAPPDECSFCLEGAAARSHAPPTATLNAA